MDAFHPAWYISKQCRQRFASYVYAQIKKLRGLNKKIVNLLSVQKKLHWITFTSCSVCKPCRCMTGFTSPMADQRDKSWAFRTGRAVVARL